MVDQADLTKVNRLNDEYRNVTRAVHNLDNGGRIVTMVISAPTPEDGGTGFPIGEAAVVPTQYIEYPPQMIAAIKQAVAARIEEIRSELADLGVTGLQGFAEAQGHAAGQQAQRSAGAQPQQQRQQPGRSGHYYRDRAGR